MSPLRSFRTAFASIPKLALTMTAALVAWSRFGVDHDMASGPSLTAERSEVGDGAGGSVAVYGDPSGEGTPVLLVHSVNAAASAYEMRPLFGRLASTRPVYALDLPGYGESTRGDRSYTPPLMSDAITHVLEHIDRPAHVVALSLGSEFSARAAISSPGRFATLALISPTGFGPASGSQPRGGGVLRFRPWSQAIFDLIASRRSIEFFLKRSFTGPVDAGLVEHAYRTSHRPGARFAPLAFLSGELFSQDAVELLYRKVSVPSLVLFDRDPFTGFGRLPDFVADHDQWAAVRIPDTAGLPHWDRPAATLGALEAHWAAYEANASTNAEW
jgi:pimeloyl-ACP methyl ester carboxylesterase